MGAIFQISLVVTHILLCKSAAAALDAGVKKAKLQHIVVKITDSSASELLLNVKV